MRRIFRSRSIVSAALLVMALFVMIVCAAPATVAAQALGPQSDDAAPLGIVAIVNGEPITSFELERHFTRLMSELAQVNSPEVLRENIDKIRAQALDSLILRRLLLQQCDEETIAVTDAQVDLSIQGKIRGLNERGVEVRSRADFINRYASAFELTTNEAMEHIRDELRINELYRREINFNEYISPRDIRSYYRNNPDQFTSEREYVFRQLVVDDKHPELEALIAELRDELKKGTPFETVVERYSVGPRRRSGGKWELKDKELEDWIPAIRDRLRTLEEGQVSDDFRTALGVTLLYLEKRVDKDRLPFEKAQGKIQDRIRRDRQEKQRIKFERGLRERAYIRVFVEEEAPTRTPKSGS